MRWRTIPREALIWRELEGELVLRNAQTGSTHLLQSPVSRVFLELLAAPEGVATSALAALVGEDPSLALSEFQRLGLATPEAD